MQKAHYYYDQAARARRLARSVGDPRLRDMLERMAGDYEDLAADLDRGIVEIRSPERLRQQA